MKPLKTTAIPEISYSSSEDEDFFDAEEDDSDDDDDGSEFDKITFCDLTSFSICFSAKFRKKLSAKNSSNGRSPFIIVSHLGSIHI